MTIDPEKYKTSRDRDDDDLDDDRDDPTRGALTVDEEMELDQLLDSYVDAGGFVFLRRQELGEWVFLAKLDYRDAKLDQIQSRFGGGKYRVEIMNDGGRRLRQRTFRIAGKSKTPESEPETAVSDKSQLEMRFERIEQLLLDRESKGDGVGIADVLKVALTALTARPPVDPLMGTLITALISGKKGGDDIGAVELQKLLQGAEDRGYNRGKELGEAIAVASGEGDGVARALMTNLPGVIDAFKSAKQSYDASRPAPKLAPAPATSVAVPESVAEGEAMGTNWINALRPAVPVIVKWARDEKDAAVKAANTVDDLSDSIRDAIAVQAEAIDFVSSVVAAIPEFQPPDIQPWVTTFLATIQEILTAPEGEEPGAEMVTA